jgi:anaphase-promoting complex subunit 3
MTSIDGKLVERRLTSLIYRFLDAELYITALFFAERLFAMDGTNHDSRHLLASVMLKLQQPHSALHLATRPQDDPCVGCLFIASQCNERLLRPKKAMELAANALKIMTTTDAPGHEQSQSKCAGSITRIAANHFFLSPSNLSNLSWICYLCERMVHWDGSMEIGDNPKHVARDIPDIAIMYCKAGILASKASLKRDAIDHFSAALTLEPLLWEAWLGLCSLGMLILCISGRSEI